MRNFVIKADFDCYVMLDGQELGVIEGGELQFERNSKFTLTIFPLNNDSLPYSCRVSFVDTKLVCSSQLCSVLCLPNANYELRFKPYVLKMERPRLVAIQGLDTPMGKLDAKVLATTQEVKNAVLQIFQKGELSFEYNLLTFIQNIIISGKYIGNEYFIIVQGVVQDMEYLLALNVNQKINICLEVLANQIEIYDDSIKTMTKCFDIHKHGKVKEYKVKAGEIYLADSYLVLINENVVVRPEFNVYAFFEALQVGDIKLGRSYLTSELNSSVDDEHLVAYFGDFVEIRQNRFTNDENSVVLIYKNKDDDDLYSKICKLELKDNKIDNIDLI